MTPRHTRARTIHLPDGMTNPEPLPDCELAEDGQPHCPHHVPECPDIQCQRRPHTQGLCFNVRRDPYRATYWTRDDD
jgi:hypothetical protein